jgi:hypothetical protein
MVAEAPRERDTLPREQSAPRDHGVPRPPHLRDFKPNAGGISASPAPSAQVIPLSEPRPAEITAEKPKRRGWWNKMLEG